MYSKPSQRLGKKAVAVSTTGEDDCKQRACQVKRLPFDLADAIDKVSKIVLYGFKQNVFGFMIALDHGLLKVSLIAR